MNENSSLKKIYLLFGVVIILMILGFLILIYKLNNLSFEESLIVKNNQNKINDSNLINANNNQNQNINNNLENQETTTSNINNPKAFNTPKSIDTNIIFPAIAQSINDNEKYTITVFINKITKNEKGIVTVYLKIFTDTANNPSELGIEKLIQIFREKEENLKAEKVIGAFKSMPPKSSIDGYLIFNIDPNTSKIILQTGMEDNLMFYEIDFVNEKYKEINIG